jgi:hypothetical protein
MALTGLLSGEERRKLLAKTKGISTDRFEALVQEANKIVSGPSLPNLPAKPVSQENQP